MITSILKIGATLATVAPVDRAANRVTVQRVHFGIQGEEGLDFCQEVAGSLSGSYSPGQWATLALTDGTTTRTVFVGRITSITPAGLGTGPISVGYHARGLRYVANQVITTSTADGTGRLVYNLPHTDINWTQNLSGLSVGTILGDYLAMHSSQLTALGIAQPPSGDLSPLTVVPADPVVMAGRILDMADALLAQWGCGKYQLFVDPDAMQLRILDTTALPAATLTFGTDPIQLPSFTVDVANCYTSVVLRGGGNSSAMVCSLSSGTLAEGWTSAQEASWTIDAFLYPSNSVLGTIASMTTSSVTADAFTGPVTTWPVNYWNGAQIWVQYGFGSNFGGTTATTQFSETAEVTAVTATSGGSATFTVDTPFTNISYTSIEVRGAPTGEALVYRQYTIPDTVKTPDGLQLNLHLTKVLLGSVPWSPTDGIVTQATGPQGEIYYSSGCTGDKQVLSQTFQIYPTPDGTTAGYIVFDNPTCLAFSSESSLKAGTPDGKACDVKVLLPYSRGALSAQAPTSGYAGTAYANYGWQNTLYRDYPNWVLKGQATQMGTLASNFLDTVKDAVIDGSVIYHGVPLALMALGQSLNLTGGLATGSVLASMACPIRAITLEWPDYGGAYQVTQLHCSNRRKPYSGDTLFLHPLAQRPAAGDWTMAVAGPRFAGTAGFGFDAPAGGPMALGEGEGRGPYRKPSERRQDRRKSLLDRRAAEGKRAIERHRRAGRLADAQGRLRAGWGGQLDESAAALDERQGRERIAEHRNRDLRRTMHPDAEEDRKAAAGRADERGGRERIVARDNARRAGRMRRDPIAHREVPTRPIDPVGGGGGGGGGIRPEVSGGGLEPTAFTELPDAGGGEELARND